MISSLAEKSAYINPKSNEDITIIMSKTSIFALILIQIFVAFLFFFLGILGAAWIFQKAPEPQAAPVKQNYENFVIPQTSKGQSDDTIIKEMNK